MLKHIVYKHFAKNKPKWIFSNAIALRALVAETLKGIITQTLIPAKNAEELIGAYEILLNTKAISNLIREDKLHQIPSQIQLNSKMGMCTMKKALVELVEQGKIDKSILTGKNTNEN